MGVVRVGVTSSSVARIVRHAGSEAGELGSEKVGVQMSLTGVTSPSPPHPGQEVTGKGKEDVRREGHRGRRREGKTVEAQ